MDGNLPGINGLEATRQILSGSAKAVVMLLRSTYEEEEYAPRAAECGAAAYIPKAVFGPDRLVAEPIGPRLLKGREEPVDIYRIRC